MKKTWRYKKDPNDTSIEKKNIMFEFKNILEAF